MIQLSTKCNSCGGSMTWAEQRRQYGRALRHGLTGDAAKMLMPRCQKCLTLILRYIPFQPIQPIQPMPPRTVQEMEEL
jgi:hypothetical protein